MLSRDRRQDHRLQHRAATSAEVRQISPQVLRPYHNFDAATIHPQSQEERRQKEEVHKHADVAGQRDA